MEKIIEIIEGLKPGVTVDENTKLLDEHVIDSLAMITLVSNFAMSLMLILPLRTSFPKILQLLKTSKT